MHFLSLALQLPLCPLKKTKEKKEKNSRKKKTFQRQAKHMQFFLFQMKQLLEQVKFKANDFEVSCLLGKNGCVCACTLLFMVSEMFVEFAYSMPKY